MLVKSSQERAVVIPPGELLRGGLKQRQFVGSSAGETDVVDSDYDVIDAIVNRRRVGRSDPGSLSIPRARKCRSPPAGPGEYQRPDRAAAVELATLPSKSGCVLVPFQGQLRVGEPHEIQEVRGNKLVGVGNFKDQFGARRRIGVTVGNVIEHATLTQLPGRFAEGCSSTVVPMGSPLAAATSSDVKRLLPVTFTSMSLESEGGIDPAALPPEDRTCIAAAVQGDAKKRTSRSDVNRNRSSGSLVRKIGRIVFICRAECIAASMLRQLAAGNQSRRAVYGFNCFSIAEITSFESGVTAGSKRCTTLPLRSTRNLVKFHLMSPAIPGSVSLVR